VRLLGVRLSNFSDASEQSTPTSVQTISNYLQDGSGDFSTSFYLMCSDAPTTSKQSIAEVLPEPVAAKVDKPCNSTSSNTTVLNFVCPVCARRLPAAISEQRANEHVDACLNRRAIAEILAEDDKQHVELSIAHKHTHTTANNHNVKRALTLQKTKSGRTIDSFFKKSRV
jgi:hypothetical protein